MNRHFAFFLILGAACGPSGSNTSGGAASPSTMAPVANQEQGASAAESQPRSVPEAPPEEAAQEPGPPALDAWATLLSTYVSDTGFRYAALKADAEATASLSASARAIGSAAGFADWTREERLAFLINAYNILTVKAVVERWPIESVMSVEGFFDGIEHTVAGESMTLNTLENERIRAVFGEPRIHFAVNCASTSCPPLRRELFTAEALETQLEEQARAFVRDSTTIQGRRATVSKLFEWFADDFEGGVRAFIADRLDEEDAATIRNERTRLRYSDYDWSPNSAD